MELQEIHTKIWLEYLEETIWENWAQRRNNIIERVQDRVYGRYLSSWWQRKSVFFFFSYFGQC